MTFSGLVLVLVLVLVERASSDEKGRPTTKGRGSCLLGGTDRRMEIMEKDFIKGATRHKMMVMHCSCNGNCTLPDIANDNQVLDSACGCHGVGG